MSQINTIDELEKILVSIGFSEKRAKEQSSDLAQILRGAIYKRLTEIAGTDDLDEIEKMRDKFSSEQFVSIINEVAVPILKDYLNAVSADLLEDRKREFKLHINSIVSQLAKN